MDLVINANKDQQKELVLIISQIIHSIIKHFSFIPSLLFKPVTFLLLASLFSFGQQTKDSIKNKKSISVEMTLGKTFNSNANFPNTKLQKGLFFSFGTSHLANNTEWTRRLNQPTTGILIGITDFGNTESIGQAITLMPYLEMRLFPKKTNRWNLLTGYGLSYMNRQFDPVSNPFNKGISTKLNWSFRSLLYYDFLKGTNVDWRFGFGYIHHSNGHTRLPNQGLNSVVGSVMVKIPAGSEIKDTNQSEIRENNLRSIQYYWSLRAGIGQNVLSPIFNDKKEVISVALSGGKVINRTFKFGVGLYYIFYEHYHDYIVNNEQLVQDLYPYLREHPKLYASNFGISGVAELLMGHVGAEINIGINFYKPFYKIDWQLNDGYTIFNAQGEEIIVLGELDSYYRLKRTVSSRLGLKWYFINTTKRPKNNIYLGAHLNANLGQANFTELSVGYVHRFQEYKRIMPIKKSKNQRKK